MFHGLTTYHQYIRLPHRKEWKYTPWMIKIYIAMFLSGSKSQLAPALMVTMGSWCIQNKKETLSKSLQLKLNPKRASRKVLLN